MEKKHVFEYKKDGNPLNEGFKEERRKHGFGSVKELDIRQKNLIQYYIDPESPSFMNKTKSAVRAGYTESSAPQVLSTNTAKVVKRALDKIFEEQGINDELLAQRHKALINKNEKVFNPFTKEIVDTGDPDTNAVSKGLDMAYKIRGDYAPEKRVSVTASISDILKQIQENERPIVQRGIGETE